MMKHFIKNKLGENSWILICYRKCKNVCLYLKRFRYIYSEKISADGRCKEFCIK